MHTRRQTDVFCAMTIKKYRKYRQYRKSINTHDHLNCRCYLWPERLQQTRLQTATHLNTFYQNDSHLRIYVTDCQCKFDTLLKNTFREFKDPVSKRMSAAGNKPVSSLTHCGKYFFNLNWKKKTIVFVKFDETCITYRRTSLQQL